VVVLCWGCNFDPGSHGEQAQPPVQDSAAPAIDAGQQPQPAPIDAAPANDARVPTAGAAGAIAPNDAGGSSDAGELGPDSSATAPDSGTDAMPPPPDADTPPDDCPDDPEKDEPGVCGCGQPD
jgi:hypothetical protein